MKGEGLTVERCGWATLSDDPLMLRYHDQEWGVPVHDDKILFEFLTLEGAQAGLSWQTVLNKRENYRKVFVNFSPAKVAKFGSGDIRRLLNDPGIIRNRLKIVSTIENSKRFLAIQKVFGSFDKYVWRFTGGNPIVHAFKSLGELPATTPESDALSKDLRKRGFRFVGSTICYSFMQAVGLVNDHTRNCFRFKELSESGSV